VTQPPQSFEIVVLLVLLISSPHRVKVEAQFQRVMTYTANLSLYSEVVYNFLAGTGRAASPAMQSYATSIGHIFSSGGETLVTTTTKSGYWYTLKWLQRAKRSRKLHQLDLFVTFRRRKKLADRLIITTEPSTLGNSPQVELTQKSISVASLKMSMYTIT